jgi:GNAT superfamily N-acetyltransferase
MRIPEFMATAMTKTDIWQTCLQWQIERVTAYSLANPSHVAIHQTAGGTAVLFDQPGVLGRMNRIFGASTDPNLFEPLLARYRDWDYTPEIWFGYESQINEARANRLGLEAVGRFVVVAQRTENLTVPTHTPEGLDIRRVTLDESKKETHRFFDIYLEAFRSPPEHLESSLAYMTLTGHIDGVHGFIARCEGEDIAVGLFYQRGNVGLLTGGATRPAWQRKGAQSAIIGARLTLARELGLSVACCHALEGSRSVKNLLGGGLKAIGTVPIWRPVKT